MTDDKVAPGTVQVTLTPDGTGRWRAWVDGPDGRSDERVTYRGRLSTVAAAMLAAGLATEAEVSSLDHRETVFVGPWSDGGLVGSNADLTVALCAECAAGLGDRVKLVAWNRDCECGSCGRDGRYYEVLLGGGSDGGRTGS